jgi:hypothetical protein
MAPAMAGRNGHPCCTEWGDLRTGMRQHPVLRIGYRKRGRAPAYPREHDQILLVKLLC